MKKIIYLLLFTIALLSCNKRNPPPSAPQKNSYTQLSTIDSWFNDQTSNQPIFQEGTIYKILKDDNEGSRHQKFIVKLENSKTLLIAHNIDIAQRIPDLQNGDKIIFKGEYEWNKKGGIVHWTHKNPSGKHGDGYLMYHNVQYD